MSDEEEVMSGEEEEARAPPRKMAPPEDEGPSEAELAMQRRREQLGNIAGVDEQTMELLELARIEREREEEEIQQLREKRELRKRERQEEEQRMAERRSEEEARRKAEEEERRRKKDEEETLRREQRAAKNAEFEKWKNPPKPNFIISKRDPADGDEEENEEPHEDRKSKEQLEAEKRAILAQRIQPLSIQGFDSGKLSEKAKELHNLIYRLESEKYDLEKRFKEQQYDMMELAERARQMNKVGEKRRQMREGDAIDPIQERFAGAPPKVPIASKYERKVDRRSFADKMKLFQR